MIKFASAGNRGSLFLIGGDASEIYFNHSEALPTILVKTFGTLCVLGDENVIQVDHPRHACLPSLENVKKDRLFSRQK